VPQTTTPAPTCATLAVTGLPDGDIETRVRALANAAKTGIWLSGGSLPTDETLCRAALALIHMTEASEVMSEAPMLVSLLASSFMPQADESPERAALLSMELDNPCLADAVANNRRLLGLPPQTADASDAGTLTPSEIKAQLLARYADLPPRKIPDFDIDQGDDAVTVTLHGPMPGTTPGPQTEASDGE